MIVKYYFWIRKIIEVYISKNILIETKLCTELVGVIVFHDEVVFTMVRDKSETNADKISKISPQ